MRPITRHAFTATRPGGAPRATALGWADVGLTPESLAWQQDAACRDADQSLFFAEVGSNGITIAAAKRVCLGCPVRSHCLTEAIERDDPHGIWGGLTPAERQALYRRRPRARAMSETDRIVARLTRAGRSAREIAAELGVTARTVVRSRARCGRSDLGRHAA